jgi:serine/threonine-protein kinase
VSGEHDRDRFQAAMALVDRALDLPAAEREAFLARECPDPGLRAEAKRLLDADSDAEAGALLSGPAGARMPSALASLAPPGPARDLAGTQVGPFRLTTFLGRGGMGEVWVAERVGADFEQKVAVKLLQPGGDAAALDARFRLERRILARLAHPRIARLLDGGVSGDGRPWLAMELVEGLALTEHCASRALGVEARLALFLAVCEAVQFAHRNLVVHRDLKPGNILVGAGGEPKLLDFGIAKLLEEDDSGALTRADERPMTPHYAAPEQVRGEAVTTASDVWALGVILHELLTGVRPFATTGKGRAEVERAILETAPSRPSSRVAAQPGGATGLPGGLAPDALRRRLKGDLDAIVLKALRREPENRYPSAEALADDVRRHLQGLPVLARGDATGYLVRSFVRRHRVGVGFSALVVAALVAGLVGTLWQARRAREEAKKAEAAQAFLASMLAVSDPAESKGKPISQHELLARGEERIERELGSEPEVQARLYRVVGDVYMQMGEWNESVRALRRSLALYEAIPGQGGAVRANVLRELGNALFEAGDYRGSDRYFGEALAIFRKHGGEESEGFAEALNDQAGVRRKLGDFASAEALRQRSLEIQRRLFGPRSIQVAAVMNDLAVLENDLGKYAEAEALMRQVIPIDEKIRGMDDHRTVLGRYNLAGPLLEQRKYAEAEPILRAAHAEQLKQLGPQSTYVALSARTLARLLEETGRFEEAWPLFDEALAIQTARFGADQPQTAITLTRKAIALRHAGKLAEAQATARRALAITLARFGEDHPDTAAARAALGSALLDAGQLAVARAELSRALAIRTKAFGEKHPLTAAARSELARAGADIPK